MNPVLEHPRVRRMFDVTAKALASCAERTYDRYVEVIRHCPQLAAPEGDENWGIGWDYPKM